MDFDGAYYRTSAATKDGKIVVTAAQGNGEENVRIWSPLHSGFKDLNAEGPWYNSLDISRDETHLIVGYGNKDYS